MSVLNRKVLFGSFILALLPATAAFGLPTFASFACQQREFQRMKVMRIEAKVNCGNSGSGSSYAYKRCLRRADEKNLLAEEGMEDADLGALVTKVLAGSDDALVEGIAGSIGEVYVATSRYFGHPDPFARCVLKGLQSSSPNDLSVLTKYMKAGIYGATGYLATIKLGATNMALVKNQLCDDGNTEWESNKSGKRLYSSCLKQEQVNKLARERTHLLALSFFCVRKSMKLLKKTLRPCITVYEKNERRLKNRYRRVEVSERQ